MARTAADVTPEEMAAFRSAFHRHAEAREQDRLARQEAARHHLPGLARVPIEEFGARRVVVHGSLARGSFGFRSDIDLATCGQRRETYIDALIALQDACREFEVDLALYESASPGFRAAIDRDGILL